MQPTRWYFDRPITDRGRSAYFLTLCLFVLLLFKTTCFKQKVQFPFEYTVPLFSWVESRGSNRNGRYKRCRSAIAGMDHPAPVPRPRLENRAPPGLDGVRHTPRLFFTFSCLINQDRCCRAIAMPEDAEVLYTRACSVYICLRSSACYHGKPMRLRSPE